MCLSVTRLRCAKTALQIKVLFGVVTLENPAPIVIDTARGGHIYLRVICAALQTGIVFDSVCLCVCLSAENLKNHWSEIDVTW